MKAENIRIVRHIGTISGNATGMMKDLNIVSVNGGAYQYDLREWSVDYAACGEGISFDSDEAQRLVALLSSCFNKDFPTVDIHVEAAADEDELTSFLHQKNVSFIDKRAAGGALWVTGGHEYDAIMAECEAIGFKFQFSEKGGKQTKNQPGWYCSKKK